MKDLIIEILFSIFILIIVLHSALISVKLFGPAGILFVSVGSLVFLALVALIYDKLKS